MIEEPEIVINGAMLKHKEILLYLVGKELHTAYKVLTITSTGKLVIDTDISRFMLSLEVFLKELQHKNTYLKQDLVKKFPQYFI